MRGYGITISDHPSPKGAILRAPRRSENADDGQEQSGRHHNCSSSGQIHLIGGPQSEQARCRGHAPAYRQSFCPLLSQHRPANRGDDQVRERQQHSGKAYEADDYERKRRIKKKIPQAHWYSLRERLIRIGRDEDKALVEDPVEGAEHREQQYALTNFPLRHVENVACQQVLELLLATGDSTEEQNDSCRGYDERYSDDSFLRNGTFLGAPRPAEERGPNERHTKRNPESDSIIEVMPHQQGHAGAQCRHLRKRKIDKNHFALYNMQTQVD